MGTRIVIWLVLLVLVLGVVSASADEPVPQDAAGVWTWGLVEGQGNVVLFNSSFEIPSAGLVGWAMDGRPSVRGDVTVNVTDQPIERNGILWEPGQMVVSPGRTGDGVAIRWTSHSSAPARIRLKLTDQSARGARVSARLTRNGSLLIQEAVEGGAPESTAVSSRKIERSQDINVTNGDVIELVIEPADQRKPSSRVGVVIAIDLLTEDGGVFATSSPASDNEMPPVGSAATTTSGGGAN